ncbi:hypothetical protein SCLARK_00629 [Spiroplasma clarkii]|nr:hypothetical protein [Spiroplasma clarkii]ARU91296.1 hypothetical protein SCLARK_00629 [Spiroplasma clarkii]
MPLNFLNKNNISKYGVNADNNDTQESELETEQIAELKVDFHKITKTNTLVNALNAIVRSTDKYQLIIQDNKLVSDVDYLPDFSIRFTRTDSDTPPQPDYFTAYTIDNLQVDYQYFDANGLPVKQTINREFNYIQTSDVNLELGLGKIHDKTAEELITQESEYAWLTKNSFANYENAETSSGVFGLLNPTLNASRLTELYNTSGFVDDLNERVAKKAFGAQTGLRFKAGKIELTADPAETISVENKNDIVEKSYESFETLRAAVFENLDTENAEQVASITEFVVKNTPQTLPEFNVKLTDKLQTTLGYTGTKVNEDNFTSGLVGLSGFEIQVNENFSIKLNDLIVRYVVAFNGEVNAPETIQDSPIVKAMVENTCQGIKAFQTAWGTTKSSVKETEPKPLFAFKDEGIWQTLLPDVYMGTGHQFKTSLSLMEGRQIALRQMLLIQGKQTGFNLEVLTTKADGTEGTIPRLWLAYYNAKGYVLLENSNHEGWFHNLRFEINFLNLLFAMNEWPSNDASLKDQVLIQKT